MSKRLQVILDDEEFEEIRRVARRHRMTVSAWVRQSLRESRSGEPRYDAQRKLEAVREAVEHGYPTGDIGELLADIQRGYGAEPE